MKYATVEHKLNEEYFQYDENGELAVIYLFSHAEYAPDDKPELFPLYRMQLNKIVVVNKPEYFVLPYIDIGEELYKDYKLDCNCFNGFKDVNVVCTGNNIELLNMGKTKIVPGPNQSVFEIMEEQLVGFGELDGPITSILVTGSNLQEEDYKEEIVGEAPSVVKITTKRLPINATLKDLEQEEHEMEM